MGMNLTEQLLSAHNANGAVKPGDLIQAEIDLIMCHEVTTPPALMMLKDHGIDKIYDPSRVVVMPDHFVPNKDIQSAELAKVMREWVLEAGIEHYYELGRHGICHSLLPEQGHVVPGQTVVGSDSHTCTHGAFGTFSVGIGSTDLAATLATGELWFKVPETIRINLIGELSKGVYSKDIVLEIIRQMGVDGARYMALEYHGDALKSLSMEARMTITNMAIEAGAKCAVMEADDVTLEISGGEY